MKNKGITLVALVITIIILLILAGISISSLTGSGLFNNAKQAKTKTTQEQIKEEIKIAYNSVQIDALMYDWNNEKKAQELEKELQKQDPDAKVVAADIVLFVSYKGYEATIDSEGNITLEDDSMGAKPTGEVITVTEDSDVVEVELKVIARVENDEIETIEPLNGAIYKNKDDEGNSIYKVTENGKYYFRIKAKNGRTAIVVSEDIDKIIIASESLLKAIEGINNSGIHKVKVVGKTADNEPDTVIYSLHTIVYDGDLHLDGKDTDEAGNEKEPIDGLQLDHLGGYLGLEDLYTLGDANDTANSSGRLAQNTVVLKVNGNLTIDENAYVTTFVDSNGYGSSKGLIIYCTGTLTNKGQISMGLRGAKAYGENVFLWKNDDASGTYEYIPAVGAAGGDSYSVTFLQTGNDRDGNMGKNGINRALGGGGTGAAFSYSGTYTIGAGGSATSYSGGAGSGGISYGIKSGLGRETLPGSSIGGSGSRGYIPSEAGTSAGGGAGNPRGINEWAHSSNPGDAANGTGGLLVIYGTNVINNGILAANGGDGGKGGYGGGASGGGSVNVFYHSTYENTGSYNVKGGIGYGTKKVGRIWRNRFYFYRLYKHRSICKYL